MEFEEGELPFRHVEEGDLFSPDMQPLTNSLSSKVIVEDFEELDDKIMSMLTEGLTNLPSKKGKTKKAKSCTVCGKEGYPSTIKVHIKETNIRYLMHRCRACGLIFTQKYALKQHELQRVCDDIALDEEIQAVINDCFTPLSPVSDKIRTPMACAICGKKIDQPHMELHINVNHPSHECDVCGDSFKTRGQLRRHKLRNICDDKELNDQIKALITEGLTYLSTGRGLNKKANACTVCGKEGYLSTIQKHIEANHINGRINKCNLCGRNSKTREALRLHKLRNICSKGSLPSKSPLGIQIESMMIKGTTQPT